MERWFCSIHFIPSPSITSIISLILLTFPLLNLRHAISPCAEANSSLPPLREGPLTLRAGRQCRSMVSWKDLDLRHLFLNLSTPRQAVVLVRSVHPPAHLYARRWWLRRRLLRRRRLRRRWLTQTVAAVAMAAVTTLPVAATAVALKIEWTNLIHKITSLYRNISLCFIEYSAHLNLTMIFDGKRITKFSQVLSKQAIFRH